LQNSNGGKKKYWAITTTIQKEVNCSQEKVIEQNRKREEERIRKEQENLKEKKCEQYR